LITNVYRLNNEYEIGISQKGKLTSQATR